MQLGRGHSVSPILAMQRAAGQHPLGAGRFVQPSGVLRRGKLLRGAQLGYLGAGAVVGESVTGIRTGLATTGVTTAIGGSVAGAIGAGAVAGSVVPIIGTAIGAIVGLLASGVLSHRTDPEVGNFNQAIAMANANGPQAVVNLANKYLVLAGLFDLEPNQVGPNFSPYSHYRRLGEQPFTTDMMTLIYNAAQAGQITANDTPQSIFNRIVNPWIQQMGPWPQSAPNAPMLSYLLMGMIADYVTGNQTTWKAVGGDYPFANLPHFALPVAAPVQATTAGTPTASTQIAPPQGAVIQPMAPTATIVPTQAPPVLSHNVYQPPTVVLNTDGSTATAGTNTGLQTSAGVLSFGSPATVTGDYPLFLNGQDTGGDGYQAAIVNGTLYVLTRGNLWYAWNGQWVAQPGAPSEQTPPASSIPSIFSPTTGAVSQPPMYTTQPVSYYPPTATPVAPLPAANAAGVSGLPSWLAIGGVGLGVLVLMFAGARPLQGGNKRSRRS